MGPAKDKRGVRESFAKVTFLFAKNGGLRIKEFWSTTIRSFWCPLARCRIHCTCHMKRRFNVQKWSEHVVFLAFSPPNVLRATTACTFSTSQLPKVVRTWCDLNIFTSNASRHSCVHCAISKSKSCPNLVCFSQIGFEMCFMPQQRAFCWHLNFQKVFWPFRLQNLLCATTACNFSPLRPEAWPGPFRAPSSSISTDSFSSDFFLFCDCFHHCCCICP